MFFSFDSGISYFLHIASAKAALTNYIKFLSKTFIIFCLQNKDVPL